MMQRGVSIAAIVLGVLLTIGSIPVGLLCTAAGVYFLYRASRGMGVPLRQRLFPYVALVCFLAACIVNHSVHAIPVMTEVTAQAVSLDAMDIESEAEKEEAERIAAEQAAQAEAEQAAQAEAERVATEQQAAQNEQSQTVYITNTGSKYHRSGCQYLKKSQIGISLNDATARGYTACSKCY